MGVVECACTGIRFINLLTTHTIMFKKILFALIIFSCATACEKAVLNPDFESVQMMHAKKDKDKTNNKNKDKEKKNNKYKTYVASLDVDAEEGAPQTRSYDADLTWHWEYGDALLGYQVAVDNIRNRLEYNVQTRLFSCPDFTYQSNKAAAFHFVYPYGAEFQKGKLRPLQDGTWRPVCYGTTEPTTIDAIPSLRFDQLSSALELRIWNQNNTAMQERVTSVVLTSDSDFVPVWALDETTMTYSQSLSGKEIAVSGLDASVVQLNMPDLPEGYPAGTNIKMVLTREDGKTMTTYLPSDLTFVKQKRTIYNLTFVPDPTFTCATYNVDGLPTIKIPIVNVAINGDGPGESGTRTISSMLASSSYDIIGFQENFYYNSQLISAISSKYIFGTYKKLEALEAVFGKADTDGLGFATLGTTCSHSNETFVEFGDKFGGLTDGANDCIKKGFRYYLVTMKDGVQIDVYVTHMNSGSDDGHINARASQFQQLANYINDHRSGRPIVIMGDFNARYTRDDYETNFWNVLDADLAANLHDSWADVIWDGYYPSYGTPSWVVSDKYDPSNTVGDLEFGEQDGEVVDKILYINDPQSDVRIWAKSYERAMEYKDLADHTPVVVEFGYEKVTE